MLHSLSNGGHSKTSVGKTHLEYHKQPAGSETTVNE